jgi:hypothetical protein
MAIAGVIGFLVQILGDRGPCATLERI